MAISSSIPPPVTARNEVTWQSHSLPPTLSFFIFVFLFIFLFVFFFLSLNPLLRTLRQQCVAITFIYTSILCLCIFTKYYRPTNILQFHPLLLASLRHYEERSDVAASYSITYILCICIPVFVIEAVS